MVILPLVAMVTTVVVLQQSLVRVVLVHPVLHAQMMRLREMMLMMMSDCYPQRQLAAPLLCQDFSCQTFVVMDDKGGEIQIKASDVLHVLISVWRLVL
jgi:hypothetical protein